MIDNSTRAMLARIGRTIGNTQITDVFDGDEYLPPSISFDNGFMVTYDSSAPKPFQISVEDQGGDFRDLRSCANQLELQYQIAQAFKNHGPQINPNMMEGPAFISPDQAISH